MWKSRIFVVLLLAIGCTNESPKIQQSVSRHSEILTIAHENPFLSLDPQKENDTVTWSVLGNIYEPLVEFDRNLRLVAALAEHWENPNDLTWRFYLRKNIRFHNGRPFTSRDVVYTIHRALSQKMAGVAPYLISVQEAKAINDTVVDIITQHPTPVLLNRLTFVFMIPESPDPSLLIKEPIGTGPYRFEKLLNPRTLQLTANKNYWRTRATIPKVQFTSYSTEKEQVDALIKGEVHLIRDFSEEFFPILRSCKDCQALTHDSLSVSLLAFNMQGNPKIHPVVRPEIRKAIYEALDSNRLVKSVGGLANTAFQLVSPNVFGFDPRYPVHRGNEEKALQLLAQGGFPEGLSIELFGNDSLRLQSITSQLKKIRIHAVPRLMPWEEMVEKMIRKELPVFTFSWSCSTGDASDFLDSCVHTYDPTRGYGSFNRAGYSNPEVDRLIEWSGQTLRVAERKELLQRALSLVMQDLPYIPLYSRYRLYGASRKIRWLPRKDGRLYAIDVNWK